MRALSLLSAILALAPAAVWAQGPVTQANWRNHPAIREIRRLYEDVEKAATSGTLQETSDSATCYGGSVTVVGRLFSDSAGNVRKYVVNGGSGDSAGEASYYYDPIGRPRFTFIRVGAANGTHREDRYYFDGRGGFLYHDYRLLKGPGYPTWRDSVQLAPREDYRRLCGDNRDTPG